MIRFVQKYKRHPLSGNPIQFQIIQKSIACLTSAYANNPRKFFVLQSIATKNVPSIDYYVCALNSKQWLSIGGIDPTPKMIVHDFQQKFQNKNLNINAKNQTSQKKNVSTIDSVDSKCDQSVINNESLAVISPTIRSFLLNTYKFSHSGKIVYCGNDASFGDYLILDDTIFHCQGGGQPSDVGKIVGEMEGNKIQFIVDKVFNHPKYHKLIVHSGHYNDGSVLSDIQRFSSSAVPIVIQQNIDQSKRELYARIHSAGHILDIAMSLIGYGNDILSPQKGYHFPDGPYVEYAGNIDVKERLKAKEKLQSKINELLTDDGIPCYVNQIPIESYLKELLHISDEYKLKEKREELIYAGLVNKENCVRVVRFGDADEFESNSCMCGGTHVDNTKRIQKIIIRKLYKKKNNFRVKYFVE